MIAITKTWLKLLTYKVVDLFIKKTVEIERKTLLVIKLDAIGDYVLFRDHLHALRRTERFGTYRFTLAGNSAWREIAENFDSGVIDEFIWLDLSRFETELRYRLSVLQKLSSAGYEVLINPSYSRTFFEDDWIAGIVPAREKIASQGDCSNQAVWQKKIGDGHYDVLVPATKEILFEHYRYSEFFSHLSNDSSWNVQFGFKLREQLLSGGASLRSPYAVLFLGGGASIRKWKVAHYVEVARYLFESKNLNIVICGGPGDVEEAKEFQALSQVPFTDMVGRTSLTEFLRVLGDASLLVSNDTSSVHFAAALHVKKIVVIFNAVYLGRFVPYPEALCSGYRAVYHPNIERDIAEYQYESNRKRPRVYLNINEISVIKVLEAIDSLD